MIDQATTSTAIDLPEPDDDLGPLHHHKLSAVLTGEMGRLYSAGFWLLPLGQKREPLLKFKTSEGDSVRRHQLSLVVQKLVAAGSSNYAIRLRGMVVVDIDTDTPEAREYVERRFGNSTVQVKTPRGIHHYYRFSGRAPAKVSLPGISIDFKTGEQSLIAGPFAERADGGAYYPLKGKLESVEALPPFVDQDTDDIPTPANESDDGLVVGRRVPRGDRHMHLKRRGMQLIRMVESEQELIGELLRCREWDCDFPDEIPDSEVESIARWFWFKRCNNQIWGGRHSPMGMTRASLDQLLNVKYGQDAWLLYSFVHGIHHHNHREFAIVPESIHAAEKLKALSCKDIRRAAQILVDHGLLTRRKIKEGFKWKYLYRITLSIGGERREVSHYITSQNGHMGLTLIEGDRS